MENQSEQQKQEVVRTAEYVIKYEFLTDKSVNVTRENKGFNAIELLGILESIQQDILNQMKGIVKPTTIKRNIIE